jgi:hypothetical protein
MVGVQGVLIGPLARRYGELRLASVGPWLTAAGFLAAAVMSLRGEWPFQLGLVVMLLICPVVSLGNGLTNPSMTSLISLRAGRREQGGTLGISHTLSSLARVVVSPLATAIFYWHPGLPYLVGAGLLAGSGGLAFWLRASFLPDRSADPSHVSASGGSSGSGDLCEQRQPHPQ